MVWEQHASWKVEPACLNSKQGGQIARWPSYASGRSAWAGVCPWRRLGLERGGSSAHKDAQVSHQVACIAGLPVADAPDARPRPAKPVGASPSSRIKRRVPCKPPCVRGRWERDGPWFGDGDGDGIADQAPSDARPATCMWHRRASRCETYASPLARPDSGVYRVCHVVWPSDVVFCRFVVCVGCPCRKPEGYLGACLSGLCISHDDGQARDGGGRGGSRIRDG
ncbi:hypothetical protein QBC39DRAFT_24934 [Podospora conica]|nr:hypothetical protein QBC39DRAFT_24934 [Schizothecium conicum]